MSPGWLAGVSIRLPPILQVLIFCENKSDVDDVHEYLLLKAVEAGPETALVKHEKHDDT